MASLFSARVMRFAVPVLALSLVGVVSYVALRSDKGASTQLARDERRQNSASQSAPSAPEGLTATNTNTNTSGFADQNTNAAPTETTATTAQPAPPRGHGAAEERPVEAVTTSEDTQPSAAAPQPPPPAAVATEGPVDMSKAAPTPATADEGEVARIENRDKSENKEKSARAPEPVEEVAVTNDALQRNRAAQTRVGEAQMPDGGSRNQRRGADNNASNVYGGALNATPPKESERERAAARSPRRAEKKADDDEPGGGETRTAAGHRFRREGNVWVDVNYRPSMPSTGVRRATEAFRALVADVPEVGRVAEALRGEVIVVVGGRAYRIR